MTSKANNARDRISHYFPYIVGGTAIVIRFFYLWSFWANHPFSQKLISDARIFDDWALRIASGDWLGTAEVFILPPLYPYLMGIVYAIFGHAPKLIIGLQAAAGCASAILVYRLGARHFGAYAGLFAGLLFASYGPQLFYEGMLLGTSGAVFLSLIGLTLISGNNKTHWHLGLAGLIFGLTALMRPNILSAIPFLLFGAWWAYHKATPAKRSIRLASYFLGGLILPLLLCGLRNGLVADDWVLMTAHGGINFYMGNHPDAPGWFTAPPGVDAQITPDGAQGNLEGPRRVAEDALRRSLKASEVSSFWFNKGLAFWIDDPIGAIAVTLRKVRLFASGYEIPLNYNFYYQRKFSALLRFPIAELWILLPLSIVGLIVAARQFDRHAILYLWLIGYAAGVLAFHVSSRYRMPAIPILMIFAGLGIWTLIACVQSQKWKNLCIGATALIILWTGYRIELNGQLAQNNWAMDPFNLGTAYLWANENEPARLYLEEAEKYGQGDAVLYYNLGLAYARTEKMDAAKNAYQQALSQDPDMVRAYVNLGNILFFKENFHEAINNYREALKRDPNTHNARANMGWAYWSLGRIDEARSAWERVLQTAPDHPSAKAGMARTR